MAWLAAIGRGCSSTKGRAVHTCLDALNRKEETFRRGLFNTTRNRLSCTGAANSWTEAWLNAQRDAIANGNGMIMNVNVNYRNNSKNETERTLFTFID